jgi:hypothetical protein
MKMDRLPHLEELVLTDPALCREIMREMLYAYRGEAPLGEFRMKMDGSPSIVFGHHPENGKFFVATKSAWNKVPKLNYSFEDIQTNHGHDLDLCDKLDHCFTYLPKVCPEGCMFQGDLMFRKKDVQYGNNQVWFTPNTITYKTYQFSEAGNAIVWAKLGICVHTEYIGSTWESLYAVPAMATKGRFGKHIDVLLVSDEWRTADNPRSSALILMYTDAYKALEEELPHYDHSLIDEDIKVFYHRLHRDEYPQLHKDMRITVLAAMAAQRAKGEMKGVKFHYILNRAETIRKVLDRIEAVIHFKNCFLERVNTVSEFKTFINDVPCKPEGMVITYKETCVKVVDRNEFSKANHLRFNKNAKVQRLHESQEKVHCDQHHSAVNTASTSVL